MNEEQITNIVSFLEKCYNINCPKKIDKTCIQKKCSLEKEFKTSVEFLNNVPKKKKK